jgi:hypothetical protein
MRTKHPHDEERKDSLNKNLLCDDQISVKQ